MDDATLAALAQMVGRAIATQMERDYRTPWHTIPIEDRVTVAEERIPADHPAREKALELIRKDLILP
jgi:alkylated DNA nucleotide flippase Atl1